MNERHEIPAMMEGSDKRVETAADLRAAREALGLSLRDVFAATRVSLSNLQAVENEDFDRLPPPVYARNFIRKYARAVGIDEKPLLARFERYLENKQPPRIDEEVRRPWPENGRRWRFLVLSLAVVILAGSLVYALFLYDQAAEPLVPAAPTVESAPPGEKAPVESGAAGAPGEPEIKDVPATPITTAPPAPPAPPAVVPSPVVVPPAAASAEQYHLSLAVHELTWIRITQDRNPPQQILLKPGERIERTATDHFLLDIGNAGGLRLTFQGKDLGVPGKSGQVLRLRLPEQTAVERKTP